MGNPRNWSGLISILPDLRKIADKLDLPADEIARQTGLHIGRVVFIGGILKSLFQDLSLPEAAARVLESPEVLLGNHGAVAVRLLKQGMPPSRIAETLEVSTSQLSTFLRKLRELGVVLPETGRHLPHLCSACQLILSLSRSGELTRARLREIPKFRSHVSALSRRGFSVLIRKEP